MKKILPGIMILFLALMQTGSLKAQSGVVTPSKYFAYSLYSFSRHVAWPEHHRKKEFRIAVVGSQSVFKALNALTQNRKHGQYEYKISSFKKASEINGFHHIIFLSNLQSGAVRKLKLNANLSNTLFVTEREGMGESGSSICFFVGDQGKIEFQLLKNNIDNKELFMSSQLISLAGRVD